MTAVTGILCIAGGGTGGHVMPAIALADAARSRWPGLCVEFIGAQRGLEAQLLPERGEQVTLLEMHAVQGSGFWQRNRVLFWELPRSVMQIRKNWKKQKPEVLVGVGGYASVSGVIAALISSVPVILYEQNAVPGMVNRQLARFADVMMLGFAEAEKRLAQVHAVVTGNVVRQEIAAVNYQTHSIPCLLVLGGSQGAQFLNETVPAACGILKLKGHEFCVLHVCGRNPGRQQEVENRYDQAGVPHQVLEFCEDMPGFYAQGDILIARSGAMSVGEAGVVGLPSIFVPLPHAADQHQWFNAKAAADFGGAVICDQQATDAGTLAGQIEEMLFSEEKKMKMHRDMREWASASCMDDSQSRQMAVLGTFLEQQQ